MSDASSPLSGEESVLGINKRSYQSMNTEYTEVELIVISWRGDNLEGWPLSGEERRWANTLEELLAGGWQ